MNHPHKHILSTSDPRTKTPDLAAVDKAIDNLETDLALLKLKRSHLLAERALIGRIPPEILSDIFEHGVYDDVRLLPTLSLVSRHWRNISLATPSLWTYIMLDEDWGYGRPAHFMRKIRMHIERSQACKLFVELDAHFIESLTDLRHIMSLLQPHLHRCFWFYISVPDWEWMAAAREYVQNLGPALETLEICIDLTDDDQFRPFTLLHQPCPHLYSIVLEHAPLLCVDVDLPSLKRLHIIPDQRYRTQPIGVSFKELLAKLTVIPTLRELRVQSSVFLLDGTEDVLAGSPVPTTLSSLTTLSFNLVESTNISLFLESTYLPALSRLCVQMESTPRENMHWLLRISHATPTRFPALRYLDLRACSIDGPGLASFVRALQQLPQLTGLALSSPPSGSLGQKIFDLLATGPATRGAWLLPRLQGLCVQFCRDLTGHELLRVVRARNTVSDPEVEDIKYLRIEWCYSLDPDALEQLMALVETVRTM